jgi:hypothetical protein
MKTDGAWVTEFMAQVRGINDVSVDVARMEPVIRSIKQDAVCAAINKLFWKVPLPTELVWDGSREERVRGVAGFWVGRLADVGIDVAWDSEAQEFVPTPSATPDAPRASGAGYLM